PPDAPVADLDIALLTYLSDGSAEGLDLQIRRFVESLHEAEAQLTATASRREFTALATGAHQLLGQARMVGSSGLAEAASRLETSARSGDAAASGEALRSIGEEIRG